MPNSAATSVAYLGPQGTFSHAAAMAFFEGRSRESSQPWLMQPTANIEDVFASVERGDALFGVVPVENSTEGAVNNTQDCLLTTSVVIVGEIIIPIVHNLLGPHDLTNEKILTIASHKQSLAQCRGWLSCNFPHVTLRECASNAQAAEFAQSEQGVAAIAGEFAARTYGLEILSASIQDHSHNRTRFLIISEGSEALANPLSTNLGRAGNASGRKTSLLVATDNKPGALFRILEPFNDLQIDLSKIEARPSKQRAWEYVFFIDFVINETSHDADSLENKLFALLEPRTTSLRVLGSYPSARALDVAGELDSAPRNALNADRGGR
jgi:chorismate mutase / prephenate dehydratase